MTIPIKHCLLALESTEMADVKRVLSHPVALAQCERFLDKVRKFNPKTKTPVFTLQNQCARIAWNLK